MKKMYTGKKETISNKWFWKKWMSRCRRMILDRSVSITLYKILFQMDHRPKCEAWKC